MGDHTGYELDGTPRAAGPLEVEDAEEETKE